MDAPFWSAGFRAFFWLGALNAAASLATWIAFLSGSPIGTRGWPEQSLHAHEMLHGTVVAAIAGFLLTAVPNWTGTPALHGRPIMLLVGSWMAGRIGLALGGLLPPGLILLLDVSFLPLLATAVGIPIVRSGKARNLPVVLVLVGLALANGLVHVGLMRSDAAMLRAGVYGSVHLVVFLMLLISGRIVPLFTRSALARSGIRLDIEGNRRVGGLALASAALALALDLVSPGNVLGGAVALVASPLLIARQLGWKPQHARRRPILWILHVGHAWIAVGFACHGLAVLAGVMPPSTALHAFTAGAMGCMILGMMTRVSLGHTGRPVEASPLTVLAYGLVALSAAVRVFGPTLDPDHALIAYQVSGTAFAAGYLVFALEFAPILWRARLEEPSQ